MKFEEELKKSKSEIEDLKKNFNSLGIKIEWIDRQRYGYQVERAKFIPPSEEYKKLFKKTYFLSLKQ